MAPTRSRGRQRARGTNLSPGARHAIKAWEDTKTHLCPGEDGYDGAEPDVWFLDGRAAESAGFRHAD